MMDQSGSRSGEQLEVTMYNWLLFFLVVTLVLGLGRIFAAWMNGVLTIWIAGPLALVVLYLVEIPFFGLWFKRDTVKYKED